jgi:Spy/CpxP family protein refolding chaperone
VKTSIISLLVVMAITGAVGAGVAHAFSPDGTHGCAPGAHAMGFKGHEGYGDPDRMIERMAKSLNLSKTQRDAMYAIVDKSRPQTRELRDRMAETHKQLHALMQQNAPKESEVRKLADAQGKAIADMIVLHTKVRAEINNVLTDAQRQQMQQWREERGRPASFEKDGPAGKQGPMRNLSNVESPEFPTAPVSKFMM